MFYIESFSFVRVNFLYNLLNYYKISKRKNQFERILRELQKRLMFSLFINNSFCVCGVYF